MTAWLLVFALAGSTGYVVPNIASDEACKHLMATIRAEFYYATPKMKCVPYPLASPAMGEQRE